jgi:Domain of unknown function (DUF4332)
MPIKKQNPFKLRDFIGVNPDEITRLAAVGIKTAGQLLSAGQDAVGRANIAMQAGMPVEAVIELVKLSDLARLPGVKGIRARLYYEAGVDTVEKLAAYEPQALMALTTKFVKKSGFNGIAPLPKEVSSTIANARKLPKLVDW